MHVHFHVSIIVVLVIFKYEQINGVNRSLILCILIKLVYSFN